MVEVGAEESGGDKDDKDDAGEDKVVKGEDIRLSIDKKEESMKFICGGISER